jgi:hypothetical protein
LLQVTGQSFESKVTGIDRRTSSEGPADTVRVMYTRLSILRPIIVAEAHRYFSSTATDRDVTKTILNVQNTLCTLCVSTAHETLEVLHDQLSTVYRSSPWHTLYCKHLGNNPRGAFPCVEEARLTAAQSRSHLHRFLLLRHYVLILDCNWIKIRERPPGKRQCAFLHFIKHTSHPLRRESRLWRDLEIILKHEEQQGTVRGSNKCHI